MIISRFTFHCFLFISFRKLQRFFQFFNFMQCYMKLMVFYKIAPVAIRLSAAGVKIMILYPLPCFDDLLFHYFFMFRRHKYFFIIKFTLFIRLYKKKTDSRQFPAFTSLPVEKQFVKNSLPPIITAFGFFWMPRFCKLPSPVRFFEAASFKISDGHLIPPILHFVGKTF